MKVDPREQILAIASSSIEAFGKMFMPKVLSAATPDFHRAIYQDLENQSIKRLAVIAPRGHSKSTVASIVYILYRILFKEPGKDLFIVLVSESQQQAINFLTIIKNNLSGNKKILAFFGNQTGKKWTEDDITCKNGTRVIALGTGQKIRGSLSGIEEVTRPNLVVFDDFESETNSGTREQIKKNKNWLLKAALPSLADDGIAIAIGTIISQFAFLADVQKPGSGWKVHFYQAFKEGKLGGEPLWPERFPKERLMAIYDQYKAMGNPSAFWQEYMNKPIDVDSQSFKDEDFVDYDGALKIIDNIQPCIPASCHPMKEELGLNDTDMIPLRVAVGVDLAISEEKESDYTVIMPLGHDPFGYRFVLRYERFKSKDIDVIVDKVFDVCIENCASAVNFETVQFQQAVANHFRKKMLEKGFFPTVGESKPRTSKDSRIRSLQPLFKSHRVLTMGYMVEFRQEFLDFPRGAHDDIPDAVWLAEQESMAPDIGVFSNDEDPFEDREYEDEESWLVI